MTNVDTDTAVRLAWEVCHEASKQRGTTMRETRTVYRGWILHAWNDGDNGFCIARAEITTAGLAECRKATGWAGAASTHHQCHAGDVLSPLIEDCIFFPLIATKTYQGVSALQTVCDLVDKIEAATLARFREQIAAMRR